MEIEKPLEIMLMTLPKLLLISEGLRALDRDIMECKCQTCWDLVEEMVAEIDRVILSHKPKTLYDMFD